MASWQPEDQGPGTLFAVLLSGLIAGFSWLANWTEGRDTQRRDMYASKEDCLQDWGEERNCEQGPVAPTGTGHLAYYYGPSYNSGQYGSASRSQPDGTIDGARPGSHALSTAHVARGGFGASGAAHGASGS